MKTDTVGIAVLDHLPLGVDHVAAPGSHCAFVGQAREGQAVWAAGQDITCSLARFNLGIDPPNEETIAPLVEILLRWDGAKDEETARRFISELRPLPFGKRAFVYASLPRMPFPPDLVIRILPAEAAMLTVRGISRLTGRRSEGRIGGVGALCSECTAIPLLCEHAAVSLGCPGSRREVSLEKDELFLSTPYFLHRQMESL